MKHKVETLLITPPFTQLSSPYSAMPFLSGYLKKHSIDNIHIDLGLEVALSFFSEAGLASLFSEIEKFHKPKPHIRSFLKNKQRYMDTIDDVISFLQGKNQIFAYRIAARNFLPEGHRFEMLDFFETDGMFPNEIAYIIAALYIDDIFDAARSTVLPFFGLSTYGPKLERSIPDFNVIEKYINEKDIITAIMNNSLSSFDLKNIKLVAVTIPFPGNLLASLKISSWLKKNKPGIRIVAGGGYVNTELNSITDKNIFKYFDYLCFDDGELPLLRIAENITKNKNHPHVRTMFLKDGNIELTGAEETDKEFCIPEYDPDRMDKYLTLKESFNVMHNLWSEKGFLKLRFAKGCYHHKCAFCDTDLDYIKCYEQLEVEELIVQVVALIDKTGIRSFHFVDEAIPPSLVKKFCLEIIRKKINITWWGNIRFEKQFDKKLCVLMSKAGCIAITGGLETANNRLLELMNKGTTLEKIIGICNNFSRSNIMVHAYLIYGFPTETANETVNSLEIIRQMFASGIINSAYYHRFTLTVHSPVFKNPDKYSISIKRKKPNTFANNDVSYSEKNMNDIDMIEHGLNNAIYNFNSGNCIDADINSWFENKCHITIPGDFVSKILYPVMI